jgi:hypothetical protein
VFAHAVREPMMLVEAYPGRERKIGPDTHEPQGPVPRTVEEVFKFGGAARGQAAALTLLRELQLADQSKPSKHQKQPAILRSDLGPLAGRPVIFGETAEKARRLQEFSQEFAPLRRKMANRPDEVTSEEWHRYRQLWEEIKPAKPGIVADDPPNNEPTE